MGLGFLGEESGWLVTWNEWERLRPGDIVESVIEYGTYRIVGRSTGPTGATAWRAISERDRTTCLLVAPRDYILARQTTPHCRAHGCTLPLPAEREPGRDLPYCTWHLSVYHRQRASQAAQMFVPCAQISCVANASEESSDGLRYCSAHTERGPASGATSSAEQEELQAWAEAGLYRAAALEESLHQLAEIVDRLSSENATLRERLEAGSWAREVLEEETAIALAKAEAARARAEAERAEIRAAALEAQLERLRRAGLELLLSRMEESPAP